MFPYFKDFQAICLLNRTSPFFLLHPPGLVRLAGQHAVEMSGDLVVEFNCSALQAGSTRAETRLGTSNGQV
jgi:hypothetical protein